MTQEAVENRPTVETQEPEYATFIWDELVAAIEKSPNLLTTQKEAVISLLSELADRSLIEREIEAYQEFVDKIKSIIDVDEFELECKAKGLDALTVIDETFRRVLNININNMSPAERFDLDKVASCFPAEHEIDDSPIREALQKLRKELQEIGQKVESQDSN